ncbi:MAG: winged helix-turn-helix transcriptional regulator [Hyphomonadaceae bacterium]|nr:winged helix-turn-helix transcriptional regulator [Hyphomonadaceae bacterium]
MNDVFKALSHPTRRKVLAMLREGPKASGEIAQAFDVAWPTMTAHLNALKDAGLVTAERDGTTIRYWLNASVMEEAVAALMELMGAGDRDGKGDKS